MTPLERSYPVLRRGEDGKWRRCGVAIGPTMKEAKANWLRTAMREDQADDYRLEGKA